MRQGRKQVKLPTDSNPLCAVFDTTENRVIIKLNSIFLLRTKMHASYAVKVGLVKDRIYITQAAESESHYYKLRAVGTTVLITISGERNMKKLKDGNVEYGFYYLKYDSKRDMYYIDLSKKVYKLEANRLGI